jgi:hypothetical protein
LPYVNAEIKRTSQITSRESTKSNALEESMNPILARLRLETLTTNETATKPSD